jgi:hypothetical protein
MNANRSSLAAKDAIVIGLAVPDLWSKRMVGF